MEIRKLDVSDEAAYRAYQTALENDDNPFITTREIGDFKTFVENSRAQELKLLCIRLRSFVVLVK